MATKAPKKFTDASQSEITEEWQRWYQEGAVDRLEEAMNTAARLGYNPEDFWPEHHDKGIGDGTWVFVVEEPHTELRARFRVPTPSLWWARPERSRPGGFNAGSKQYPVFVPGIFRAVIETPGGSLWLYPHEYVLCDDPLPLITDPECTIHPLGGRVPLDEEQEDQVFYLQSRGWPRQDALLTLLDGLDMRDWGWVEFPEYAREMFEGVGARPRFARVRVEVS